MQQQFPGATGIIPACAGSTSPTCQARSSDGDHPRMRGEHFPFWNLDHIDVGSSPHARGAQLLDLECAEVGGIIPACAGSTAVASAGVLWPRDHPRMRGEHNTRDGDLIPSRGSSPHARGARRPSGAPDSTFGIIPACAGSTKCSSARRPAARDHPRMRGEHRKEGLDEVPVVGSSPHARGALENLGDLVGRDGIIPACAGSTKVEFDFPSWDGDHPRMRGEHVYIQSHAARSAGSSPHARGAPVGCCRQLG